MLRGIILIFLLILSPLARAADIYTLSIRNIEIGELVFSHSITGSDYRVLAQFRTKGLADALFGASIIAETRGKGVKDGAYAPDTARILTTIDGERNSTNLTYSDGIIEQVTAIPRRLSDIDPETQRDAVDPLTAIAYIMRDLPQNRLCRFNITVFDGFHASRLNLGHVKQREDGRFQCNGGFERVDGYDEAQIQSEGTTFYMTVLYRPDREAGAYKIDRIVGQSPLGQFQLLRNY